MFTASFKFVKVIVAVESGLNCVCDGHSCNSHLHFKARVCFMANMFH